MHLGALAGVRPSLAQPKRYQRVNIEGTLNLLEACRAHGVARFVFASSSSVYGAHNEVPFRERDPAVRPASPYAASKRAGELFCSNYSDLYGIATTALRFFTVYGPRQRPEMAIHKFARLIADGKPLPFYGDGSTARDYTFIDDIIDGVVAVDRSLRPAARIASTTSAARARRRWRGSSSSSKPASAKRRSSIASPISRATCRSPTPTSRTPPPSSATRRRFPIEEGIARFCAWLKEQQT